MHDLKNLDSLSDYSNSDKSIVLSKKKHRIKN